MKDSMFGELHFDGCCWSGHLKLDWFGETRELTLMIDSCHESQTEVSDRQRETCRVFLDRWPELQEAVGTEIIRYYNGEERFAYGPDDPEEFVAWWPEIETVEEMVKWVTLDSIAIESDSIAELCRKGKRCLYLLFSNKWASGNWDCNGIGIRLVNEEIDETGYQDIAF